MTLPSTTPPTTPPTTAYRRHPQIVLAAVESGLRELGLDHLYTHAYPAIGILSVAPGITAWCDGRRVTCHHASGELTWPAVDAAGAARQLAELAKSIGEDS